MCNGFVGCVRAMGEVVGKSVVCPQSLGQTLPREPKWLRPWGAALDTSMTVIQCLSTSPADISDKHKFCYFTFSSYVNSFMAQKCAVVRWSGDPQWP